jgi:hypothetical protein
VPSSSKRHAGPLWISSAREPSVAAMKKPSDAHTILMPAFIGLKPKAILGQYYGDFALDAMKCRAAAMRYRRDAVANTRVGNLAQVNLAKLEGWLPLCGALDNVQAT